MAFLDTKGHLVLAGRNKETVIINGVNYFPHEIEAAIEDARIEGVTPHYTVVISHRPENSDTEALVVIYLPSWSEENSEAARALTSDQISKTAVMHCGARPYAIIPVEKSLLPKSNLGKLSRAKLRIAFEKGDYDQYRYEDEQIIDSYRAAHLELPSNETEKIILDCITGLFNISCAEVGVNTSLFEFGMSSIDIIKLKTIIQHKLQFEQEIPVITVMNNPTIKGLAAAVLNLHKPHEYNPIVTLQSGGSRIPLFLVHPGVDEVLVFLNLANFITDRPVHAIRARGFDGEPFFNNLREIVEIYHDAFKKTQTEGPYAIAGYSYGTMLAFEVAKKLEANGDEVKFLGSFNLPPHIKFRMKQLYPIEVLLNLAYFLDLITEECAEEIPPAMHKLSEREVLDFILAKASASRMIEMALDRSKLERWVKLASALPAIARDYEPTGTVATMDVFYAIPLKTVCKNKADWLENHLSKWQGFVREQVRFTEVDGAHYTMVSDERELRALCNVRLMPKLDESCSCFIFQ